MSPELQTWIEDQKPELVTAAETYVDQSGIYAKSPGRDGEPQVSGAQLRNLLNVAQGERSLKVLINFLRYQIGRGRRGWEHRRSGEMLEVFLTSRVAALCSEEVAVRYVIREYRYVCGGREKRGHG
jgi:hypothetical protein